MSNYIGECGAENWSEDIAEKRLKLCEEEASDSRPPVCLLVCLGTETNSNGKT
jgi:hypothetical protein